MSYPNDTWNLELTKAKPRIDSFDGIINHLLKKGCKEICIIKATRGFVLFRTADKGESHLLAKSRVPFEGKIVKRWENGEEVIV